MKNHRTARTKAAVPIMHNAKRLILLSGTPALSRPMELFTQISGIKRNLFPTYAGFLFYFTMPLWIAYSLLKLSIDDFYSY